MTSSARHIVRRQIVEAEVFGSESDGFAVQRRVSELCRDGLISALGRAFETVGDEHLTIDRLEIDVGTFDLENLERDLLAAVSRIVEIELRGRKTLPAPSPDSLATHHRSDAQALADAFLHFLRTGTLPWWFQLPDGTSLEEVVLASWRTPQGALEPPALLAGAIFDEMRVPSRRRRLANQFSESLVHALIAAVSRQNAELLQAILAKLHSQGIELQTVERLTSQLWQAVLAATADRAALTPSSLVADALLSLPTAPQQQRTLRAQLEQAWPEAMALVHARAPVARPAQRDGKRKKSDDVLEAAATKDNGQHTTSDGGVDLSEGVFVGRAGVVLLHPFLPQLFETLGVADGDTLLQPERALCLLHFLATGQRIAPEYELVLPKVLCNVPLDAPVATMIEIGAREEEEAVVLLRAAIRHWAALGDTSIDALRGTFLVRPGKLSRRESGDALLQVETRSVDILLDQLPWGIGVVQLPWMRNVLWVEWRP